MGHTCQPPHGAKRPAPQRQSRPAPVAGASMPGIPSALSEAPRLNGPANFADRIQRPGLPSTGFSQRSPLFPQSVQLVALGTNSVPLFPSALRLRAKHPGSRSMAQRTAFSTELPNQ